MKKFKVAKYFQVSRSFIGLCFKTEEPRLRFSTSEGIVIVLHFSLKPAPTVLLVLVLVLFLGIILFNCSRLLFMTARQQGLR